jgi:hypothetical protein
MDINRNRRLAPPRVMSIKKERRAINQRASQHQVLERGGKGICAGLAGHEDSGRWSW